MNKHKNADKLYDAIGYISDEYVFYAQNVSSVRRHTSVIKAISALAACCVMLICISTAIRLIPSSDNAGDQPLTLSAALSSSDAAVISTGELNVFDGQKKLIWLYDDEYRALPLTDTEFNDLTALSEYGNKRVDGAMQPDHLMWLCDGNGKVKSPYLYDTLGNTSSYLFGYAPEIIPSEEFTQAIIEIVKA